MVRKYNFSKLRYCRVQLARSLPLRAAQPALDQLTPENWRHIACPTRTVSHARLKRRQSFSSLETMKSSYGCDYIKTIEQNACLNYFQLQDGP